MRGVKSFTKDEDGAITVDWVVLTAGVIGIALAGLSVITSGTKGLTENISGEVAGRSVSGTF